MKDRNFEVCPEGFPIIFTLGFCAIFFGIIGASFIGFLFFILTLFSIYFFRDPPRYPMIDRGDVLSPADGKVLFVGKEKDPLEGKDSLKISIFMDLFSVHVNRAPVKGEVKAIIYKKGKFLNASLDKASKENEQNIIHFRVGRGENFVLVQVAGLIARRIVCWLNPKDKVEAGDKIGLIKFGSRVELYMPENYDPLVSVGEKVFAGESVIAIKKQKRK